MAMSKNKKILLIFCVLALIFVIIIIVMSLKDNSSNVSYTKEQNISSVTYENNTQDHTSATTGESAVSNRKLSVDAIKRISIAYYKYKKLDPKEMSRINAESATFFGMNMERIVKISKKENGKERLIVALQSNIGGTPQSKTLMMAKASFGNNVLASVVEALQEG